ncbi:MAG TPA: hypothetical protein VGK48_20850 [Terriglobia bacterium]
MTIAMTVTQVSELADVSKALLDLMEGLEDAVQRLLRIVGDLVGPASPDPKDNLRKEKPWT